MPFYRFNPQVLQRDQHRAFKVLKNQTPQPTRGLQRSASILSVLIKINGIMPRFLKGQQNLQKKRHFCLKNKYKKALLFNKKALLFKNLLCKINANLLKRIKRKTPFLGGRFLYRLRIKPRYDRGNTIWQD